MLNSEDMQTGMQIVAKEKYSDKMKTIDKILSQLQTCDDVDRAIEFYTQGQKLISDCKKRIDEAKLRFEQLKTPEA